MTEKKNIRLLIQYDGRKFCGWQRQLNGISIQECIEDAVEEICRQKSNVVGASRTDSGVHALGQVASAWIATKIPTTQLLRALNSALPPEIRVVSTKIESEKFHAIFSALEKTYRYLLQSNSIRSPFLPCYMHWVPYKLALDKMQEAAEHLVGTHDFAAFMGSGSSVQTTVRHIKNIEITEESDIVKIMITADGFLRHMVRIIVGTLLKTGSGKFRPDKMLEILQSRDRREAGTTAAAKGLTLMNVVY